MKTRYFKEAIAKIFQIFNQTEDETTLLEEANNQISSFIDNILYNWIYLANLKYPHGATYSTIPLIVISNCLKKMNHKEETKDALIEFTILHESVHYMIKNWLKIAVNELDNSLTKNSLRDHYLVKETEKAMIDNQFNDMKADSGHVLEYLLFGHKYSIAYESYQMFFEDYYSSCSLKEFQEIFKINEDYFKKSKCNKVIVGRQCLEEERIELGTIRCNNSILYESFDNRNLIKK
jgi:hypothetical protein